MNTHLMQALMVLRLECSRALDALQENKPVPPQLSIALDMADEELSSESYRQRVLAKELAARDRARTQEDQEPPADEMALAAATDGAVQRRLESLERLRALAQEHGFINADGAITLKLKQVTGIELRESPEGQVLIFRDSLTDGVYNEGES